jgi:hypothetical protein
MNNSDIGYTDMEWNYNEYQRELDVLFLEYNMNPFERGIS